MKKILFFSLCSFIFLFNCDKSKDTITGTQASGDKIQILEIKRNYEVTCINDSCFTLFIDFGVYRFKNNSNLVEIFYSQDTNVTKGNWGRILVLQELTMSNEWHGMSGNIIPVFNIPDSISIVGFGNFNDQKILVTKVMNDGTLYIKNDNKNYQINAENEITINSTHNDRFLNAYLLIHNTIRIINHGYFDKNNIIIK